MNEKKFKSKPREVKGILITILVKTELLKKIKALAYWKRETIKSVVENAINDYVYKEESYPEKKKIIETSATLSIRDEFVDKIKNISHNKKKKMKDVFDKVFQDYVDKYESEKGVIEPKP